MEVASPPPSLPFGAGTKRQFPVSSPVPGLGLGGGGGGFADASTANSTMTMMMDEGSNTTAIAHQQRCKRRRFVRSDDSSMSAENMTSQITHSFLPFYNQQQQQQSQSSQFHHNRNNNNKRRYAPSSSPVAEAGSYEPSSSSSSTKVRNETMEQKKMDFLQTVVASQQTEITKLKSDKAEMGKSLTAVKADHDKVVCENRTLKRAVLIQQERQNQAVSELQAAHRYKADAEDKIRKLDQLVLSLRYHLQAKQNNSSVNDFMNNGTDGGNGFVF